MFQTELELKDVTSHKYFACSSFYKVWVLIVLSFPLSRAVFFTERSNLLRIRKTQGNFAEKKHLVQEAENWRDWIWRKYKNREERRTICGGRKMRAQFLTKSKS